MPCGVDAACNDGNDATTEDVCSEAGECAGTVTLGAQLSYDIPADAIPEPASPERAQLELTVTSNLALVLSAGGMICAPDDLTVISIAGGSVVIDYTVEVAVEFSSPEIRATARAAVEDPASAGLDAEAMAVTIGGQTASGASAMHFRSYAWVLSAAVCPEACGTDASDRGDT